MSSPTLIRQWQRSTDAPRLTFLVAVLLAASSLPLISHGQLPTPADVPPNGDHLQTKAEAHPDAVPGEILVRFRSETVANKQQKTGLRIQVAGRELPMRLESLGVPDLVAGLRLVRVEPEATGAVLAALNNQAEVLYAEPNYVWHKLATPNDPPE